MLRSIREVLGILVLCWIAATAAAQGTLSSLRQCPVSTFPARLALSTDSIPLETIGLYRLDRSPLDSRYYSIDSAGISFRPGYFEEIGDSMLLLEYRIAALQGPLTRQVLERAKSTAAAPAEILLRPTVPRKAISLSDLNGLRYSGSFSRGIALGNRQDLSSQSGFNLQLSGWLSPDLEVLAALSDQSVPLQPEGNTQQLRDFDQVFVQLRKDSSILTAGDFDQNKPPGYFLNYVKRSLGVQVQHAGSWRPGQSWRLKTGISLSRGQFYRYTVPTREGNQGPYPLPGAKGERLIVILANTERIYLDGILLTRGLEQDYVMDYNLGTITFSNKRLITKDSRVIAEYEYTELSYSRSLLTLENQVRLQRWTLQTNAYSQQDSRKGAGWQNLDETDKALLAEAGDQVDKTLGSGIRERTDYQEDEIRYAMADTLVDGKWYSGVLVRSTDPALAKYTARFTELGPNKGHYIRIEADANGSVYQWVAPDALSGQLQGRFEPLVQLVAPGKQEMITLGAQYLPPSGSLVATEFALSNVDKNRYSSRDDGDNQGIAWMTRLRQNLQKDSSRSFHAALLGQYEFRQASFREINPYRNAEFARDWNLPLQTQAAEQLGSAGLELSQDKLGSLDYRFQYLQRGDQYSGYRHTQNTRLHWQGWELQSQWSLLNAADSSFHTRFWRPRADLSKVIRPWKDLRLGLYTEHEKQERSAAGDSLLPGSFQYSLYKAYVDLPASGSLRLRLSAQERRDAHLSTGRFEEGTLARDWSLEGSAPTSAWGQLDWNATYRQLRILHPEIQALRNTNSYLGRLNYSVNALRGALRTVTTYELGSGQEPRTVYVYQKTLQPGTGQYIWKDLNQDSIQQVNEFFIAPFQDQADYVRFALLSDEYTPTYNILFNQSLQLDPALYWKDAKGLKAFLSRWSSVAAWRLQRKSQAGASLQAWNPFMYNALDTGLVSMQTALRAQLFFNRNHPVYEWQLSASDLRNRYSLSTGPESQTHTFYSLQGRLSLQQAWTANAEFGRGAKLYRATFFPAVNYDFQYSQLEPRLSWQPDNRFRLSGSLLWKWMHSRIAESPAEASLFKQHLEFQWSAAQKTSLRSYVSLAAVKFDRPDLPALELAMLEGLKAGKKWLWGCSLEQRLSSVLQLILSYEGRNTAAAAAVHVGRAQIRALF